ADEGRLHVVSADQPHGEARAGAGIAEVEGRLGLEQATIADAVYNPLAALLLDTRAHRLHRLAGAHDILALEQAGDAGFAGSQAAEHEGAVRNRLVAGHARDTLQCRRTPGNCRA